MRNADEVIISLINEIKTMVLGKNFTNASRTSSELIRFSTLIDNEDMILIGEVLESVFSQIKPIFDNYILSDEEISSIIDNLGSDLNSLIENYQTQEYEKLYYDLRNLRAKATKLQLNNSRLGKLKEKKGNRPSFNDFISQVME